MKASVGDLVYVASAGRSRAGVIAELRHPDGTPPYVVRWLDTGGETVLFPRGRDLDDVRVVPRPRQEPGLAVEHRWAADIELIETGQVIHVVAGLFTDDGRAVEAVVDTGTQGAATLQAGEALAVADALDVLASELRAGATDPGERFVDVRTRAGVRARG